jgi:hypothetical protein
MFPEGNIRGGSSASGGIPVGSFVPMLWKYVRIQTDVYPCGWHWNCCKFPIDVIDKEGS